MSHCLQVLSEFVFFKELRVKAMLNGSLAHGQIVIFTSFRDKSESESEKNQSLNQILIQSLYKTVIETSSERKVTWIKVWISTDNFWILLWFDTNFAFGLSTAKQFISMQAYFLYAEHKTKSVPLNKKVTYAITFYLICLGIFR